MVDETSAPSRSLAQKTGLYLGAGLFLVVILFFDLEPGKPIVTRMAAVAVLMAVWPQEVASTKFTLPSRDPPEAENELPQKHQDPK
jgi:hypothetical protein